VTGVQTCALPISTRFIRHEFENSDSIHFVDSLKFTTPGGKIVYGGGGIMPDKFVPFDTLGYSPYFVKIRPLIYQFALSYSDSQREALAKFTNARDMEKYLSRQGLLDKFINYTIKKSVKPDPAGLKISGKSIEIQLKAYIARNILDNKGFYPIWEELDTTLKYAIDYLK
jgi:carboxyl-terminal processing protease